MKQPEYNDDYPTCVKTYSTLRIFSDVISPKEVKEKLGIEVWWDIYFDEESRT